MIDETRFPGDDTIKGYSGPFKELLICLQLELKICIFTEEAFPKSIDFERAIKTLYATKMQENYENKCENRLLLELLMYMLMSSSSE